MPRKSLYNAVCQGCRESCKASSLVIIERCPHFKPARARGRPRRSPSESKHEPSQDSLDSHKPREKLWQKIAQGKTMVMLKK